MSPDLAGWYQRVIADLGGGGVSQWPIATVGRSESVGGKPEVPPVLFSAPPHSQGGHQPSPATPWPVRANLEWGARAPLCPP